MPERKKVKIGTLNRDDSVRSIDSFKLANQKLRENDYSGSFMDQRAKLYEENMAKYELGRN